MKRLTPCTIIPPELYVHREADRQLLKVIQEMGRPGYILVARQMGKTNLLLNAKRELEDDDNAFIYVDLSAPFETERECFRHIIDTALETKPNAFGECRSAIFLNRITSKLPPYKEHEVELRTLLNSIMGKIVIILDEIDSLTKGGFSDKIFAQIRSVYFSRLNFPEYKRLTYILSGVIEPNEIIKDKKISPFNIGEKIYLSDFTIDEYSDFLCRAGLILNKSTAERVHYWANGNPRITWDICAALETKLEEADAVDSAEVDRIVNRLYLEDYNKAPIDHIRELVAGDDELRNAIVELRSDRGDKLPDSVRSKLYLAGIIRSGANLGEIKEKNRIIEAALSTQWLKDVGIKRKGLIKIGDEKYEEGRYSEALAAYEEFVANNEVPDNEKDFVFFHMGVSAYRLGEYEKSIRYFEETHWDKHSATELLYYEQRFYLGLCFLQTGNIEASRGQFEDILRSPKRDRQYVTALQNLAATYSITKEYEKALEYFNKALEHALEMDSTTDEHATVLASLYYNLGSTLAKTKAKAKAREQYDKALEFCRPQHKPAIMIGLFEQVESKDEKHKLLNDCVEFILANKLRPSAPHPERTLALNNSHYLMLLNQIYSSNKPLFAKLLDYTASLEEFKTSGAGLLLNLAFLSVGQQDLRSAIALAEQAIKQNELTPNHNRQTTFRTYQLLSLIGRGPEQLKWQKKYLNIFSSSSHLEPVNHIDLAVFASIIRLLISANDFKAAIEHVKMIKRHKNVFADPKNTEGGSFTVILFQEMNIYSLVGDWVKASRAAQETLDFIEGINQDSDYYLISRTDLNQAKEHAKSVLVAPGFQFEQNNLSKIKIGRNDKVNVRYSDGRLVNGVKFKKIETDLIRGDCKLIN